MTSCEQNSLDFCENGVDDCHEFHFFYENAQDIFWKQMHIWKDKRSEKYISPPPLLPQKYKGNSYSLC